MRTMCGKIYEFGKFRVDAAEKILFDGADVTGGGNRESTWIGPTRRHALLQRSGGLCRAGTTDAAGEQ